jgi:hypothetical protein
LEINMKLTFDEALDRMYDDDAVKPADVQARALRRVVFWYDSHFAGCLSESRGFAPTKASAVESLLAIADNGEGPPRGMKAALQRYERFQHDGLSFEIARTTLGDLL